MPRKQSGKAQHKEVFVQSIAGNITPYTIDSEALLYDLESIVHKNENCAADVEVKFILHEAQLQDSSLPLTKHGIEDGTTLTFVKVPNPKYAEMKERAINIVARDGLALRRQDSAMRRDLDVVLAAVKQQASAFQFADQTLRSNREMVVAAASISGFVLQHVSKAMRKDREVVLAAVRSNAVGGGAYANTGVLQQLISEGLI
jgi:hypothetical protein